MLKRDSWLNGTVCSNSFATYDTFRTYKLLQTEGLLWTSNSVDADKVLLASHQAKEANHKCL